MRDVGGLDRLIHRFSTEENMIDRGIEPGFLYTEPGGGVTLRIQIDQDRGMLSQGQPRSEANRRCGLTHAALLVHHCNDLGYSGLQVFHEKHHHTHDVLCCTWNALISQEPRTV